MDYNDIRFQQNNNATPYISGTIKERFRAYEFSVETMLNWPAQSSDLNPIEHVWYLIGKTLFNTYPD